MSDRNKPLYEVKVGEQVTIEDINQLVRWARRNTILPMGNRGIQVRRSVNGTTLDAQPSQRAIGIVDSTIGPGSISSGIITFGTGTAYRQAVTAAGLSVQLDTGAAISVYGITPIAAGCPCWLEEDMAGNWIAFPMGQSVYTCQFASTLVAATGTYPSITPSSTTVTVYQAVGGSLVGLGTCEVYNFTATAFAASKTTTLGANGDGTFYVIEQDC